MITLEEAKAKYNNNFKRCDTKDEQKIDNAIRDAISRGAKDASVMFQTYYDEGWVAFLLKQYGKAGYRALLSYADIPGDPPTYFLHLSGWADSNT